MVAFRNNKFRAFFFAVLLAVAVAGAADEPGSMETYKVFLTRNPFGLKDPPSKAPDLLPEPEPEPASDLRLTGMRSLNGQVLVMFVRRPVSGEMELLSVKEGKRSGTVEVLKGGVNINAGTVRVKVRDVLKTLSFDTDGYQGAF